MRPIRIFKAESFRLAALFTLLFLMLTGTLLGAVLWIVDQTQRRTLVDSNDADITTVINGFRDEGLDEAIEVVRQRLGKAPSEQRHKHFLPPDVYIVIENARGEVLAGNLATIPCGSGILAVSLPPDPEQPHARALLGRCVELTEGVNLFVGRDTAAMAAARGHILRAFGWVALGICVFATLAGLLLGRRFLARVDTITQTCERIIAGQLDERIPLKGRGDEWDRLAGAINEMLDRISALLENLKQVSSDVAHDLRTPLTRLRNRLEESREKSGTIEDCRAAMARAIDDTDHLLSMFSALLRISQVESGTRVRTFSSVNLSELLERVYQLYLPVAEDCGHPLGRHLLPALFIRGDDELLIQMFSNLIENAMRHTPAGAKILVALNLEGENVLASISDDGPGVAVEDRDKVLLRFYQGSASRSLEGHGLGLSLVAAIARIHGAKLELADAKPGLRVAITFLGH